MAIVIKFKHLGFSRAKYHEVIKQLENAGQGNPVGRFYHVCYGSDNEVDILDVWDNMEDFNAFGKTLIPYLLLWMFNLENQIFRKFSVSSLAKNYFKKNLIIKISKNQLTILINSF